MAFSFSKAQWEFIATLEIFDRPIPIDLMVDLTPLQPSELLVVVNNQKGTNLIELNGTDLISLSPDLGPETVNRIREINTPDRLSQLIDKIEINPNVRQYIGQRAWADLFARAERFKQAALIEYDLGVEALQRGNNKDALEFFDRSVDKLGPYLGQPEIDTLFVSAALELSHLRYHSGKRLDELMDLFKKSREAAERLGDQRSLILIELNMGRREIMTDLPGVGLNFLTAGLEKAERLGDSDILARSQEFRGLYYYIHGRYREAVEHFETALQRAEMSGRKQIDFLLPQWLTFSSLYRGQIQYAKSLIMTYLQRALSASEKVLAENFRATFGLVMMMTHDIAEAKEYLNEAMKNSQALHNPVGRFHAHLGLSRCKLLEGDIVQAHRMCTQAVSQAIETGVLMRQYTWPWFLEMLFAFYKHGLSPVAEFVFPKELDRIMESPNLQLKGIALRLRARMKNDTHDDAEKIWSDLVDSETLLKQSGSTIELAKTWLEMAKYKNRTKDRKTASRLATLAWERLSGFGDMLFPEDLKSMVDGRQAAQFIAQKPDGFVEKFLEMMDDVVPAQDEDFFLRRILIATGRFLGSERGGIFWYDQSRTKGRPILRMSHNLTRKEVQSEQFERNMALVKKALSNRKPIIVRSTYGPGTSVFCAPFKIGRNGLGLLYHDSTRFSDTIESRDNSVLERVASQLGAQIERMSEYAALLEEKDVLDQKASYMEGTADQVAIITRDSQMKKLLALSDRVADSEATVLLVGETGVGKELFARRMHKMNASRRDGSFVAVDFSTIPETLLESELFGYEKGAFSGAHRQKPGLLELASGGTLFIDEAGDIPPAIQVKLLRVLQEKSFFRVGGTHAFTSDFRLVAASNRNVTEMVSRGAFREDLYYRLNVITLEIPPLRRRGQDAMVLARHFLSQYMKKYNRRGLFLTPEDETLLASYAWPGNVRELKHIIERAVILSTDGRLEMNISQRTSPRRQDPFSDNPSLNMLQKRYIEYVLDRTGGKIGGPDGAAQILGMKRTTLYARMKKLGLDENTTITT